MAQAKMAPNPSIIDTIDKMVKEGESEEKILNTLKDIGISPDNARRLLILGQADVFSLLKGEIRRTIKQEIDSGGAPSSSPGPSDEKQTAKYLSELREYEKSLAKQNDALKSELEEKIKRISEMEDKTKTNLSSQSKAIQEQVAQSIKEYEKGLSSQNRAFQEQVLSKLSKGGLSEKAKTEFLSSSIGSDKVLDTVKGYQKNILDQNKNFEQEIYQKIQKINELEEKTQKRLNQMSDEVKKVEADIGEVGFSGVGSRNKFISYAVIGLGLVFGAGTLFTFYTNLQAEFTTQSIITMTVMAIITVTLLVVGTLI